MTRRYRIPLNIVAIMLGTISLAGFWRDALAGPITGTYDNPPIAMAVYQGVISIIPGGAGSIMEIGNQGQEINSTGTMYFRPFGMSSASAPRVVRNVAGKADIQIPVPGQLCLGGVCRDQWPIPAGATLWEEVGSQLTPITQTDRLLISEAIAAHGAPSLRLYGDQADAALFIKNQDTTAGNYALHVTGDTNIQGTLETTGDIWVDNWVWEGGVWIREMGKVWHAGNDGINSQLDADSLDGVDLFFQRETAGDPSACSILAPNDSWCICKNFGKCIVIK